MSEPFLVDGVYPEGDNPTARTIRLIKAQALRDAAALFKDRFDPALSAHTNDEVCTTQIYTLKTEEWHEWEDCTCYSHPTQVTSVKWSKTAEKFWLTRGFVPTHMGVLRKHDRWSARFDFQNQLIKEEDLCPA